MRYEELAHRPVTLEEYESLIEPDDWSTEVSKETLTAGALLPGFELRLTDVLAS